MRRTSSASASRKCWPMKSRLSFARFARRRSHRRRGGSPVTLRLTSKGISYGVIRALPDGSVDTSCVEGVDADLRVRPFFHHGGTFSIREFIVGALKNEWGWPWLTIRISSRPSPGGREHCKRDDAQRPDGHVRAGAFGRR